jgi:hypothetical protein
MPIRIDGKVEALGQEDFGEISYRVMDCIFDLHREVGRLFAEDVYRSELVRRLHIYRQLILFETLRRDK